MKYITRNLESVVNQVTKEYPVILVTGSRQVGKTTMFQSYLLILKCWWTKITSLEHFG